MKNRAIKQDKPRFGFMDGWASETMTDFNNELAVLEREFEAIIKTANDKFEKLVWKNTEEIVDYIFENQNIHLFMDSPDLDDNFKHEQPLYFYAWYMVDSEEILNKPLYACTVNDLINEFIDRNISGAPEGDPNGKFHGKKLIDRVHRMSAELRMLADKLDGLCK